MSHLLASHRSLTGYACVLCRWFAGRKVSMDKKKLKAAERRFLDRYPGGFAHPDMVAIGKKHKVEQMVSLAQQAFKKRSFVDPYAISAAMVQMVSRASMVSLFEKPRFRDLVATADARGINALSDGLKHFLHGNQAKGFETLVAALSQQKLAKWSLVTIIPNYYQPDEEVFVKPTTAKGVIEYFGLTGLEYKPQPSWDFYKAYREAVLEMRSLVHPSIAPNNAAFCGFLMMSTPR